MRLLLTRPEPDAARTAALLRERGHDVVLAPLLRIEPVAVELTGSYAAILMTSANAARAIAAHPALTRLLPCPVFAVGDRTAAAARTAGFRDVVSAEGALPDLLRLVAGCCSADAGRLLYLAGEDRAGDLAGDLAAHGIAVDTVVIYRASAAPSLPAEAARALAAGALDGALHYSARSLAVLLALADAAGVLNAALSLRHYCLSAAVAAPLRGRAIGRVEVARSPGEAALIDLVGSA